MKFFYKILIIPIFVLLFPSFSYAQSASFSVGPNAVFEEDSGQITADVSGNLSLESVNIQDVGVFFNVYDTPPPDINDPNISFNNWFLGHQDPTLNNFSSSNSFFGTISGSSQQFLPGTNYYFLFRLAPQTVNLFPTTSVLVTSVSPGQPGGNNNPPSDGGNNNPPTDGNNNPGGGNATDPNGTATTAGWPQAVFQNPLNVTDLNGFVIGLLNALLKIGIPVMVIFLVYSGLRLVMARGNEKELESAKTNLLWVVVGVLILLSAWTIVKVLKGTFDELNLVYVQTIINFIS
ncbi:MAG: pilin [Candidatus Paceibacterota bacterium]